MSKRKLLEAYAAGLERYSRASLADAAKQLGALRSFKVSFADGPYLTRLYNLGWTAHSSSGAYATRRWEDGIDVHIDTDGIRKLKKAHPALEGFFITEPDEQVPLDARQRAAFRKELARWFAGRGGALVQNPFGDPIHEFDQIVFMLVDDAIQQVRARLAKDRAFKQLEWNIEGHDGIYARPLAEWDDVLARFRKARARDGYLPSIAFLRAYVSLFTSNTTYATWWARSLRALAPASKSPPRLDW